MTTGLHSVRVEALGGDIVRAVNQHVNWASGSMPVLVDDDYETHLLFTYCHRLCDDTLRIPMELNLLLANERTASKITTVLEYSQSRRLSVGELLGTRDFKGVCFAWTERPTAGGFCIGHKRLAPVFYAFYQNARTGRLDCVHSSPSRSNYQRERIFWVPEDGARVTGIACAPLDAYESHPEKLSYTFGLKEGEGRWRHATMMVPFQPTLWIDVGDLFETRFKVGRGYTYSIEGAKGKGWLMTETSSDFNLHHL
jgi:hypothetical protein